MASNLSGYAGEDLWSKLLDALKSAGKDPTALKPEDFGPIEHFHTGGRAATEELLRLAPAEPRLVLDIGGGIGGPARFLAQRTGATVVVAEISPNFCRAGSRIDRVANLEERVAFVCSEATALPFATATFDLIWMQQAGMNIARKQGLLAEIARVLAPGGSYCFQEIMAGAQPGPLTLPAPWAARQEDSHLTPAAAYREMLLGFGLQETAFKDVTESLARFTRDRLALLVANGSPPLGVHLLSSADVLQTTRNTLRNIEDGRIRFVRGAYRKP
jgi:ubiquinone/menaquinone biosynthesis C-methylase UbiE